MPRIVVVGGGRWGSNHIRTLSELGFLAAIVEADPQRQLDLLERYPDIKAYDNVEGALDHGYDGYVVATPAETHYSIASKILEAGNPALVEKPLALTSADARALVEIANANGQHLMVGHLMLFHPAVRKIKSLVESGKLGRLQYLYSNRANLGTVRSEENILWSFAPHDISIFQYLLGVRPLEVLSRGGAYLQPGIHDSTLTTLRYPNNVMCHNFVSWLHPFKEHRIVVIGSKGMLSFEDSSELKPLRFYEKGIDSINGELVKRDGPTEEIGYDQSSPLAEELSYFADHLGDGFELANASSAIEVLEILEQASSGLVTDSRPQDRVMPAVPQPSPDAKVHPTANVHADAFIHESSYVDAEASVGTGSKIWHFCHIQPRASVGANCSIGQSVNIGPDVRIGSGVKIQNNVSVFEGVEIEDDVFCGPSMTFTNVLMPRAERSVGAAGYLKTLVKRGASLGANCVIVCGNTVGKHAFVAAGAVVTQDVPDYALVAGVPAKQIGWMTAAGSKVEQGFVGVFRCELGELSYEVSETGMQPIGS
ncbi:MAG: Gfo/Idh/MocA family oxidoreductase [Pseudomonadales bacterium]